MLITLELTPDLELKLRQSLAAHDTESVRRLLADALIPTVEALLHQEAEVLPSEQFEVLTDQLVQEFATFFDSTPPTLSDYAVSRAGIYEARP